MSSVAEDRGGGAAPAVVTVEEVDWNDARQHKFSFRRLLQFMGPGILMSIAYVDPGNLESDLQVGAQAGYVLLWLLLLSTAMGLVVQMQAAKLGVVTGQHLAQHCRQQYPTGPRIALWLMAEIAIIGSDVQEVIGSAIALALLSGGRLPLWAGVLFTAVDSFALLFIERLGIRVLEGFFAGMVAVMVAAFGVMYVRAEVPLADVVRGFTVPQLPKKDLPVAVALMGSLIMPHNIYLHSALVQTRKLGSDHPAAKREALTYFGIESALSLVVAVVINLFITAVFAAGFFGADLPDIGLQNAGRYLGDTYGQPVVYIWALGLLAAGQSSTMTGTYTGQFVMGGFLDLKVSPWARVALTRAVAIAPTLAVALLCSGSGNQLDQLNQGLNLLQSIQLPFALVPVLTFTSSPVIMGQFANSAATSALCWAIAALVVLINMLAVYQVAYEAVVADPWVSGVALGVLVVLYLALIAYLALGPQSQLGRWLGWKGSVGEPGGPAGRVPEERAEAGEAGVCIKAACGCCAGCRCWAVGGEGQLEVVKAAAGDGGGGLEGKEGVKEGGGGEGRPGRVCGCRRGNQRRQRRCVAPGGPGEAVEAVEAEEGGSSSVGEEGMRAAAPEGVYGVSSLAEEGAEQQATQAVARAAAAAAATCCSVRGKAAEAPEPVSVTQQQQQRRRQQQRRGAAATVAGGDELQQLLLPREDGAEL